MYFIAPAGRVCVAALLLFGLAGCASTGTHSPSARPVLYPNATLNRVGDAQGRAEADACMGRAVSAGLTPDEKTMPLRAVPAWVRPPAR